MVNNHGSRRDARLANQEFFGVPFLFDWLSLYRAIERHAMKFFCNQAALAATILDLCPGNWISFF